MVLCIGFVFALTLSGCGDKPSDDMDVTTTTLAPKPSEPPDAKAMTISGSITLTGSHSQRFAAGADGRKLELVPTSATDPTDALPAVVTKSVAKNNNGRSFKVVRVEQQEFDLSSPGGTLAKTTLQYAAHNKAALVVGDEVTISRTAAGTPCQYLEGATDKSDDDGQSRLISGIAYAAAPTVIFTVAQFPAGTPVNSGCTLSAYRTVLVVDSMPDTMSAAATGADIEMDIYGPKGSCSVSETVKGTYESDVCSSRGSCDGGSGLCTCHEGYSGEACETQTVLV